MTVEMSWYHQVLSTMSLSLLYYQCHDSGNVLVSPSAECCTTSVMTVEMSWYHQVLSTMFLSLLYYQCHDSGNVLVSPSAEYHASVSTGLPQRNT